MENEVLQQILSMLETVVQGQTTLENSVTKIELSIENEIWPAIKVISEQHGSIIAKLDRLSDLNEQVIELKTDTSALKTVTRDLVLKAVK